MHKYSLTLGFNLTLYEHFNCVFSNKGEELHQLSGDPRMIIGYTCKTGC